MRTLLVTAQRIRKRTASKWAELCYVVYVALLEGVPGDPPYSLYVGSASGKWTTPNDEGRFPCEWPNGPQRRYRDHKRDRKAGAGWVRDFGIGLLPELYGHLNPITDDVRQAFEEKIAVAFRAAGWVVHQH